MATSVTLKPERFPITTSVGVYPANSRVPGAHPVGPSLVEAQEVGATGSLTFTGLTDATPYQTAAEVGGVWRYYRIGTSDVAEVPTFLLDRIKARREALGVI